MRISKFTALAAALSLIAASAPVTPADAAGKTPVLLDISQFTVRDENLVHLGGADYLRGAQVLFDEQDKVPESLGGSVSADVVRETSKANWTPNQQMEYGSADFYIDFGANYVITGIAFLDTNGVPVWTVSDGTPFNWHDIATVSMDTYNWWRSVTFDDPQPTRYLHFSSDYCDSGVSEMAIYGYKSSDLSAEQMRITRPVAKTQSPRKLTAGQAAGTNIFIDDPITAVMAAGNVREYHNLSWLFDASGKIKFTQGTWGDMDSFYGTLKDRGISAIPCFQGGSTVISGESKTVPEKAVPAGADTLDPASYALHAQAMYQVAARYGSNKDVDLSTINITDAQEVKVGMGLMDALENSNEPNKSWSGSSCYFSPYEMAAMCSADYDGHEGTIKNAGVKQADPNFRLAVGGLLTPRKTFIQYLDEMKLWFDYNRSDGKFAVDILNIHISPDDFCVEDSSLQERVAEIRQWIEKNAPGTELWISEFEIPMSDCEKEGTDAHDDADYQLKYAQRVARTYLTAHASGADRITKFQLRDEGEGVYYNSGLVTQKGKWTKKPAWYALSCMTTVLRNADLTGTEQYADSYVYTYENRLNSDIIRCAWSPTNSDREQKNFAVSAGGKKFAYLTVPSGCAEGTTTPLAVKDGKVTITLTETPVYITFTDKERDITAGKNSMLRPVSITENMDGSGKSTDLKTAPEDGTMNQFYRMFDEPGTMPDPIYGDTEGLTNPETNVNRSGITAYAHFDQPCVFSGFGVFDTFGTGGISVYDAHTDRLLWHSDLDSYMSRSVTLTADSAATDCLKIVKEGGDLNELAFYGHPGKALSWDLNRNGRYDTFDLVMMREDESGDFTSADLKGLSDFLLSARE